MQHLMRCVLPIPCLTWAGDFLCGRNVFDRAKNQLGAEVLKVEKLCKKHLFEEISFSVRSGEVLGFSGLIGAGRSEVMKSIFGFYAWDSGTVYLDGQRIRVKNVKQAMEYGIAYLTEDRKYEGI